MPEKTKEPWLNYLALTTVILAVCATLASFMATKYGGRSVINQAQASDQWAYYQAKSIKGNLYQLQRERVQLELELLESNAPAAKVAGFRAFLATYEHKVSKYDKEKIEIEQKAVDLEMKRDDAQKHVYMFGVAVLLLQISILISSIAALLKHKWLWHLALPIGFIGTIFFGNAYLLLF